MNVHKIALLTALSLALISACSKYETQYEGPYKDGETTNPPSSGPVSYEIVFVQDGQLFMASADLRHLKALPQGLTITKASINYAHDRIAYKPEFGGNLVIIDTTGTLIQVLPNTSNVNDFDWHANNQTLYMLEGSLVKLHGPSINIEYTNLFEAHPFFGINDYHSLTVLPDGTVAFGLVNNSGSTYYIGYWIGYASSTGLNNQALPDYEDFPDGLRSSSDGNRLLATTPSSMGTFDPYLSTTYSTFGSPYHVGAMSPNGQKFVYWNPDTYSLVLYDTQFSAPIGSGTVTDMDW